jgi:uncharacterized protein
VQLGIILSALFDITANEFRDQFSNTRADGSFGRRLLQRTSELGRDQPEPGEVSAWNESLAALADALHEAGLGDLTMFIEFAMPPALEYADVILAGPGRAEDEPVYVLVELKQWTEFPVRGDGKVDIDHREDEHNWKRHPWKQAVNYVDYLSDAYGLLKADRFYPVAFLHNATDSFMAALGKVRAGAGADMFGASEVDRFQKFLQHRFRAGSSTEAAGLLRRARVRQSETLLNRMDAEFDPTAQGRFVLLNEQQEAYELVAAAAERAELTGQKAAVIVHGRPGTGKTAVALKLAGSYFCSGKSVYYRVWHTAFREALIQHSGVPRKVANHVFISPRKKNATEAAMKLSADLSICDEAHRLEAHTITRSFRREEYQLDDILWASRVHVFFVDDDQQVTMTDIGTVERLEKDLKDRGIEVEKIELKTQFRNGGVAAYVHWVRCLVGLEDQQPEYWRQRDDFKVWIAEWPGEVEEILQSQRGEDDRYRMTAGYCWKWPTGKKRGKVEIGQWSKFWNLRSAASDGPKAMKWAWDKNGEGQVGCVHTAQGLEWEWAGVIIGKDLVLQDGHIVPVLEENIDLPNYADDPEKRRIAEKLIRNAYYILLTRGMRGMVIYAQDEGLRNYLRSLVEPLALPLNTKEEDDLGKALGRVGPDIRTAIESVHESGAPRARSSMEYVPRHRSVLAWREQRVVILGDHLAPDEAQQWIDDYAAAGWEARQASNWDPEALQQALRRGPK